VAPVAVPLAIEGIDPNALALVLQLIGASPVGVGLFFGLWLGGRAIAAAVKLVLEAKADAGIRAVVGLTMAIRNASQQSMLVTPLPQERRPTTRGKRTGPNPTLGQGQM
jgi:hypothetical protein